MLRMICMLLAVPSFSSSVNLADHIVPIARSHHPTLRRLTYKHKSQGAQCVVCQKNCKCCVARACVTSVLLDMRSYPPFSEVMLAPVFQRRIMYPFMQRRYSCPLSRKRSMRSAGHVYDYALSLMAQSCVNECAQAPAKFVGWTHVSVSSRMQPCMPTRRCV